MQSVINWLRLTLCLIEIKSSFGFLGEYENQVYENLKVNDVVMANSRAFKSVFDLLEKMN